MILIKTHYIYINEEVTSLIYYFWSIEYVNTCAFCLYLIGDQR